MKYLLLIYGNEAAMEAASASTPQINKPRRQRSVRVRQLAQREGLVSGRRGAAGDSTATSVRAPDDEPIVTDGPFAETKERLGGYYVLDVANVDDAIEAGSRCPGAMFGTIELRPVQDFPDQPQG